MRPLYDDGASKAQEATRDYVLKAEGGDGEAPILNIFGGKITTYRRLAEAMLEKIEGFLGARGQAVDGRRAAAGRRLPRRPASRRRSTKLKASYPFLDLAPCAPADAALRHAGARRCSGCAKSVADLGRNFGADLYEAEVRYLVEHEWAVTAEDVLWRRTKRGLQLSREEAAALEEYMNGLKHGMQNAAAE